VSETPPPNSPADPPNPPDEQGDGAEQPQSSLPSASGRATSVRFRADADVRESARAAMRMDAANQSLAEALKITFRLVQLGMVVLVLLFLGSALRMVQEGERGIRVVLGKVQNGDLGQGLPGPRPTPSARSSPSARARWSCGWTPTASSSRTSAARTGTWPSRTSGAGRSSTRPKTAR